MAAALTGSSHTAGSIVGRNERRRPGWARSARGSHHEHPRTIAFYATLGDERLSLDFCKPKVIRRASLGKGGSYEEGAIVSGVRGGIAGRTARAIGLRNSRPWLLRKRPGVRGGVEVQRGQSHLQHRQRSLDRKSTRLNSSHLGI